MPTSESTARPRSPFEETPEPSQGDGAFRPNSGRTPSGGVDGASEEDKPASPTTAQRPAPPAAAAAPKPEEPALAQRLHDAEARRDQLQYDVVQIERQFREEIKIREDLEDKVAALEAENKALKDAGKQAKP
ncbi:hypothetical protein BC567DRAFT_297433 [Phyllosticta citribraziliensis]